LQTETAFIESRKVFSGSYAGSITQIQE